MHGNVSELVADRYGSYDSNAVTDPTGPASGSYRVNRGGSWGDGGAYVRSARRYDNHSGSRFYFLGFRVGFQKVQ